MSGEMQVLLFDEVSNCGNVHEATTAPLPAYAQQAYGESNQQQQQQQQSWMMQRPMLSMDQQHNALPSSLPAPNILSSSYPDNSVPSFKSNLCRSSSPTSSQVVPRSPASTSSDDSSDAVDLSKLSKAELRKHKNRESAARSRKRSRERMQYLETLVRELRAKNRHLEQTVQMLSAQRMPWGPTPSQQSMQAPPQSMQAPNEFHRPLEPAPMMGMSYYDPSMLQH